MKLINAIPVAELAPSDLLLSLALSLTLTAGSLAGAVLLRRRGGGDPAQARPTERRIRFTLRDDRLVEAPSGWTELIRELDHGNDWDRLRRLLALRFAALSERPVLNGRGALRLVTDTAEDPAALTLRQRRDTLVVTLEEPRPGNQADRYRALAMARISDRVEDRLENLPVACWTMVAGQITGTNAAFRQIEGQFAASTEALAPLLRSADLSDERPTFSYRAMLPASARQPETWVDVFARRVEGTWQCTAQDVTALVKAERAQRNFVQTLTKTFAQLSTGLAIFDRDRQLILFNPALLDLTQLSPEFLSSRPALSHFFDNLRDRRIMPEPKNYASWREQINELVTAAADGRYHETWSLPNGATYRVTGRPHPNGAVAFLFEDITDHISMTRRFRQQLSLSQSVLDAFSDGIAIFDSDGMMSHCNRAYRAFFQIPDDTDLTTVTAVDAHRLWSSHALSPFGLDDILSQLVLRHDSSPSLHNLSLKDRGDTCCTVLPLPGGARMVSFGTSARSGSPATSAPASTVAGSTRRARAHHS